MIYKAFALMIYTHTVSDDMPPLADDIQGFRLDDIHASGVMWQADDDEIRRWRVKNLARSAYRICRQANISSEHSSHIDRHKANIDKGAGLMPMKSADGG